MIKVYIPSFKDFGRSGKLYNPQMLLLARGVLGVLRFGRV